MTVLRYFLGKYQLSGILLYCIVSIMGLRAKKETCVQTLNVCLFVCACMEPTDSLLKMMFLNALKKFRITKEANCMEIQLSKYFKHRFVM